jgi:hypothetical protein
VVLDGSEGDFALLAQEMLRVVSYGAFPVIYGKCYLSLFRYLLTYDLMTGNNKTSIAAIFQVLFPSTKVDLKQIFESQGWLQFHQLSSLLK